MRLRDLYKVETLDTRLLPAGGQQEQKPLPDAKPSRWNTREYYIYYAFFLTIPFLMFKTVYDVSQSTHPNYSNYENLLSPGWVPGRKVDNSDTQYKGFRDNIPYMALILALHPLLRRAYDRLSGTSPMVHANGNSKQISSTDAAADARLDSRVRFDLLFAVVFIVALHGFSAIKVFLIIYANFQIATALPRRFVGITTWTFNIGILFANELCQGYPFASIFAFVLPPQTTSAGSLTDWGSWLDSYGGWIPRWEILFNFTILRLIAFNFDYIWMRDRRESSPVEKKNIDAANLPEKERIRYGANSQDFTFRHYLAYILYAPLYLAGPIINFNDYISQSRHQLPTISQSWILPYAVRFAICLLFMELLLHFHYTVAISKSTSDWSGYTPFQLTMLGYFGLHVVWLKLLLPWRFFRLWALLDGIDAPENMLRCASDNYSTLALWRGWHRSYNLWVMRYIYIPLGGSRVGKTRAVANFLAVFTFVALWHDINLRLLIWGWTVVFLVLPEVIATLLFPAKRWIDWPNAYRWLCGVGGVANLCCMMISGIIGFVVGVDGFIGLCAGIFGTWLGRLFFLSAYITCFVGVQIMFEVRQAEKRRGINMKC